MSESENRSVDTAPWRLIGDAWELSKLKCQRIHAKAVSKDDDLVLIHVTRGDRFFAMGAWCSHQGGPLFSGDIEDFKGRPHIMCPWHAYMFDVEKGTNEIGIQQEIFPLKLENGKVYIKHKLELSTSPFLNQPIV